MDVLTEHKWGDRMKVVEYSWCCLGDFSTVDLQKVRSVSFAFAEALWSRRLSTQRAQLFASFLEYNSIFRGTRLSYTAS
jgi:hypothetical protein